VLGVRGLHESVISRDYTYTFYERLAVMWTVVQWIVEFCTNVKPMQSQRLTTYVDLECRCRLWL